MISNQKRKEPQIGSTILGYAGFALFAALVILGYAGSALFAALVILRVIGKLMGGGSNGGKGGE